MCGPFNKLMLVFHAFDLLHVFIMNFIMTLSKYVAVELSGRKLLKYYDEIHCQQQDRRMKN